MALVGVAATTVAGRPVGVGPVDGANVNKSRITTAAAARPPAANQPMVRLVTC